MKVELADLKNTTGIDTSKFAKQVDLADFKLMQMN